MSPAPPTHARAASLDWHVQLPPRSCTAGALPPWLTPQRWSHWCCGSRAWAASAARCVARLGC